MSGKRAKPTPWRFVRATPVAVAAVVVWVLVGLFFLLPGSGTGQGSDWAVDPIPSNSDDEAPTASDSPAAGPRTAAPSADRTPGSRGSEPGSRGAEREQTTPGDLELADAPAPAPDPPSARPSSDPTAPAPTDSTPGPPEDNPGKKKGHDKPHGPHGRP